MKPMPKTCPDCEDDFDVLCIGCGCCRFCCDCDDDSWLDDENEDDEL